MPGPVNPAARPILRAGGAEAPPVNSTEVGWSDWLANQRDQIGLKIGAIDPATYRGRDPDRDTDAQISTADPRGLLQRMDDALADATSRAGTGEVGYLARRFEDLLNIDDSFLAQQFPNMTAEEREEYRDRRMAEEVRTARAVSARREQFDPAWREGGSIVGNVGRFGAGLVGDLVGNVNPTYLIGGGSTILRRMAVQGAVNGAIDVGLQSGEMAEGVQDEFDLKRAGTQVVAGALLQGAFDVVPKGISGARGGFEKVVAQNWQRLPEGIRQRWSENAPLPDTPEFEVLLADTAESIIGPERMSEAEADSVAILRREGHLAMASPFERNGAGQAAHDEFLGDMISRIMAANPAAPVPPRAAALPALPANASPRARIRAGTAIATETVAGDASSRFMQRVRHAESSGNDTAVPRDPKTGKLLSSAFGRYQFLESTWLAYYKRRYGTGGLSDTQISAKRADGRLQEVLMSDFTADNAAVLRKANIAITEGNLYLAHFAGPAGAKNLHRANPNATARSVLGNDAINANRFLEKMSAADVIAWAHRKMGGKGAPLREGAPVVSRESVREDGLRSQLQQEIDRLQQESAAIEAELAGDGDIPLSVRSALDEDVPVTPLDDIELEPLAPLDSGNSSPAEIEAPAEVQALLPALRERVSGRKSLNVVDDLAEELGASADEIRIGFNLLAGEGRITMNRVTGKFMRKPDRADENELLEFIAKAGGLRDDEGHALGLSGLSKQERAELVPSARRALLAKRRRRTVGRDWQRMTRSHGKLLRHEGMSVDGLGELLWEAGWFLERPTVAKVLDLVEQRIQSGKDMFPPGADVPAAPSTDALTGPEPGSEEWDFYRSEAESHLYDWMGFERDSIDMDMLDEFVSAYVNAEGRTMEEAVFDAWNIMAERNQIEAIAENPKGDYEYIDYDPPQFARSDDLRKDSPTAEDIAGQEAAGSNAQAGGIRGGRDGADAGQGAGAAGPKLADIPAQERAAFLDPDNQATIAQAASLEHDARMMLPDEVDPNIAAVERKESQLRADQPLRGARKTGAAQDGTMPEGLFGGPEQPDFLMDPDLPARSLKDVLNEAEADAASLKNIRDCL